MRSGSSYLTTIRKTTGEIYILSRMRWRPPVSPSSVSLRLVLSLRLDRPAAVAAANADSPPAGRHVLQDGRQTRPGGHHRIGFKSAEPDARRSGLRASERADGRLLATLWLPQPTIGPDLIRRFGLSDANNRQPQPTMKLASLAMQLAEPIRMLSRGTPMIASVHSHHP